MKQHKTTLIQQKGFTLFETIITVIIFSIIAFSIGELYLSGSKQSSHINSQTHMQQTSAYIVEMIIRDLRNAAYIESPNNRTTNTKLPIPDPLPIGYPSPSQSVTFSLDSNGDNRFTYVLNGNTIELQNAAT